MRELNLRLLDKGVEIEVDDDVKQWLIKEGYEPLYGARPMRRTIQRAIGDPLSEEMIKRTIQGMPKDPRGASRRRSGIYRAGGDGWRLMSQPCTCAYAIASENDTALVVPAATRAVLFGLSQNNAFFVDPASRDRQRFHDDDR